MKKKYSTNALLSLFPDDQYQQEDDIVVNYMITKKKGTTPDVEGLINCVIAYVQNSEIYFTKSIGFVHDVLVFSIVGAQEEQTKLKDVLGGDIDKFDCVLEEV